MRQQSHFRQMKLARQQASRMSGQTAGCSQQQAAQKPAVSRRERLRALIADRSGKDASERLSRRELTLRRTARLRAERQTKEAASLVKPPAVAAATTTSASTVAASPVGR